MARLKSSCLFILISTFLLSSTISADEQGGTSILTIEEIMVGDHRSPANIARNQFRNPIETLEFFGLKTDMTLIEIGPSGAWYTEILAPYMRDHAVTMERIFPLIRAMNSNGVVWKISKRKWPRIQSYMEKLLFVTYYRQTREPLVLLRVLT